MKYYLPFALAVALLWGGNVCLRLVELPKWNDCEYCQVDGQWLMATHDAYFWLAGAEGTARSADRSVPRVVRFIHKTTGVSLPSLGFWLPALLAPLAVIPLCLLAFRWKISEAALPFGILAAGCFGYLQRTRLGYLDDDFLALLFPATLGVALIFWLSPLIREAWNPKVADRADDQPPAAFYVWLGALGVGLLFRSYMWAYGTAFPIAASMTLIAGVLGLLLARSGMRSTIVTGLVILFLTALVGWPGLVVAAGLLILARVRPDIAASGWLAWGACAALLAFLVLGGHHQVLLWRMLRVILVYANLVEPLSGGGAGLAYPSAMETIREAIPPSLDDVVMMVAGHWAVAVPALLGYCWLVWKRPAALVFLPLLGLAFAAYKLGYRFTMYGGIPLGLGLGFLICEVMDRARLRSVPLRWAIVLILTMTAMYPVYARATKFVPYPILSPPLAAAMLHMETAAEPNAQLWQWWDYGYAAQYYARRHTFSDGARQHGPWLFPLALVHSTDSPLQARQMMLLMAESFDAQERVQQRQDDRDMRTWNHVLDRYSVNPGLPMAGMDPETAMAFVEFLGTKELRWPGNISPQYLVLGWDNMALANVISRFGNHDLRTGASSPARAQRMHQGYDIRANGFLMLSGMTMPLTSFTVVQDDQAVLYEWDRGTGKGEQNHVVVFESIDHAYVMDGNLRDSMMVRLLIDDPVTVAEHFELVYENFPWARVYRVRN